MIEVSKNYFLLYHARNSEEITFADFKELSQEEYSIYSLVLSISKNSFAKIIDMESFQKLLEEMDYPIVSTLIELYPLKKSILRLLESQESSYNYERVLDDISYLRDQEVITLLNYQKLLSLFHRIEEPTKTIESNIEKISFLEHKTLLQTSIQELSNFFTSSREKESLLKIEEYLLSQRFSLGVTGVINAGKSTLINALLGKEILGNSMVPETANLTIIKEGDSSANVHYWNEKEWEKISATSSNRIEKSSLIEKYIQKKSFQESISIEQIREFTSATVSKDAHYKLVKSVELYQKAPLLSQGIEIVDTPGLDDPVVLREEISKEYLSKCDAMIHLMNVNQSATQKDVEFIIDALLYQKISHLLVVLSHADTVSTTEMKEVISYTKSSLSSQLEALGKSSHLSFVLKHIHFLPVSAKAALGYRTQKESSEEQLKTTGILEIEAHLHQLLYGEEALKARLILHKSKQKLRDFIVEQQAKENYQLSLFSKNKEELEESLIEHQAKSQRALKALKEDIEHLHQSTSDYVERLGIFLDEEFVDLQALLTQRLFSDVQYTHQKSKKKPDESRLETIIATTVKDGVLETTRDYGYRLRKRCEKLIGGCQRRFEILKDNRLNALEAEFETLFSEPFNKGFLTFSTQELSSELLHLISKSNAKEFTILHQKLNETINKKMDVEQIKVKAKDKSLERIEAFFQLFYTHIEQIEREEKNEEKMLELSIQEFEHRDDNLQESISSLLTRQEQLNLMLQRLES